MEEWKLRLTSAKVELKLRLRCSLLVLTGGWVALEWKLRLTSAKVELKLRLSLAMWKKCKK